MCACDCDSLSDKYLRQKTEIESLDCLVKRLNQRVDVLAAAVASLQYESRINETHRFRTKNFIEACQKIGLPDGIKVTLTPVEGE